MNALTLIKIKHNIGSDSGWIQHFASIHDPIYNLHRFPRDRFTSAIHRELCKTANRMWRDITGL